MNVNVGIVNFIQKELSKKSYPLISNIKKILSRSFIQNVSEQKRLTSLIP